MMNIIKGFLLFCYIFYFFHFPINVFSYNLLKYNNIDYNDENLNEVQENFNENLKNSIERRFIDDNEIFFNKNVNNNDEVIDNEVEDEQFYKDNLIDTVAEQMSNSIDADNELFMDKYNNLLMDDMYLDYNDEYKFNKLSRKRQVKMDDDNKITSNSIDSKSQTINLHPVTELKNPKRGSSNNKYLSSYSEKDASKYSALSDSNTNVNEEMTLNSNNNDLFDGNGKLIISTRESHSAKSIDDEGQSKNTSITNQNVTLPIASNSVIIEEEHCSKYFEPNNATIVLERILEELKLIRLAKENGQASDGAPCNIIGSWNSETIGLRFDISAVNNNTPEVSIKVENHRPPKMETLMDTNWTCNGFALHQIGGPFYITATKKKPDKLALFTGICKNCGGIDTIFGTWSFVRQAKDCKDLQMAIENKRDILRKETLQIKVQQKLEEKKNNSSGSKDVEES